MPINNYGSDLSVETNVNGIIKQNDDWIAERSQLEHQQTPSEPWAQGYEEQQLLKQKIRELYEEFAPLEADPEILNANRQDLKTRNLDR